ncbi:MAG: peptidase [Betaproteobacteria bacterium]|nr:peptidase [Betaproteobacteria bacterium]
MIRLAALCAALLCTSALAATEHARHTISVRIDPPTRSIEGSDTIRFDASRASTLTLAQAMHIQSIVVDGRSLRVAASSAGRFQRISVPAARKIEVRWTGALGALDKTLDHRGVLSYDEPATGTQGTYLPSGSGWYPMVRNSLESYNLELDLPAAQRGLVPGQLVHEREADGRYRARFEFREPAEGIALMAGPYRIEERRLRTAAGTDVRLRTYFHPEITGLAQGYLDSIAGYLDLYERWIGAYPFSEFSVVSSPTPTGFGMPTLTYLGIDVLRLPFIRATSLGHEVLHNWWGNGVYPDYASGNWAEGLTTFMADYAYRERDGAEAATAMRLGWLRDYAAMPPRDDLALIRFTSRTHGAAQVVGYNKAAMFFYMLRDAVGAAAFDEGVRIFWREHRFKVASWDDLRRSFEASSGKPLAPFFEQWLKRPGAPALAIDAAATGGPSVWRVSVTLTQGTPPFAISVPVSIRTAHSEIAHRVDITRDRETVTLDLPTEPLAITLDPELRIFRRLGAAEAPPILREVFLARGAGVSVLSADTAMQTAARQLAARLFERPAASSEDASALLVIGLDAEVDNWLAQRKLPPRPATLAATKGTAQVWTLRADNDRTILLVSVRDAAALAALAGPLPHYGQQSYLIAEGARVVERGIWPSQPQVRELKPAANPAQR